MLLQCEPRDCDWFLPLFPAGGHHKDSLTSSQPSWPKGTFPEGISLAGFPVSCTGVSKTPSISFQWVWHGVTRPEMAFLGDLTAKEIWIPSESLSCFQAISGHGLFSGDLGKAAIIHLAMECAWPWYSPLSLGEHPVPKHPFLGLGQPYCSPGGSPMALAQPLHLSSFPIPQPSVPRQSLREAVGYSAVWADSLGLLHPLCPPSSVPGWMFETWRCCITIIAASSFDYFPTNWQGKELLCLLKGRKDTIHLLYS